MAKKQPKKRSKKQDDAPKMVTMQIPTTLRREVTRLVTEERLDREEAWKPLDRKKLAVDQTALVKLRKAIKELHKLIKPVEKQGERLENIDRTMSRKDEDWVSDQMDILYDVNEQLSNLTMNF